MLVAPGWALEETCIGDGCILSLLPAMTITTACIVLWVFLLLLGFFLLEFAVLFLLPHDMDQADIRFFFLCITRISQTYLRTIAVYFKTLLRCAGKRPCCILFMFQC